MNRIDLTTAACPGHVQNPVRLSLWVWAALTALRTWRRLGTENAQLRGLDERALRDLGLSRVDALAAAREPRWRVALAAGRKVLNDGGHS